MKQCLLFALMSLILASACSTKVSYIPSQGVDSIPPEAMFAVGEVVDETGFSFPADEKDKIVLSEAMAAALKKALTESGIIADGQLLINVTLTEYAPGNAFKRWLMPGAGATKLNVVAYVVDQEGTKMATIPVERYIGMGGGYTVGAWKYVFDEVATAIVQSLAGR